MNTYGNSLHRYYQGNLDHHHIETKLIHNFHPNTEIHPSRSYIENKTKCINARHEILVSSLHGKSSLSESIQFNGLAGYKIFVYLFGQTE